MNLEKSNESSNIFDHLLSFVKPAGTPMGIGANLVDQMLALRQPVQPPSFQIITDPSTGQKIRQNADGTYDLIAPFTTGFDEGNVHGIRG